MSNQQLQTATRPDGKTAFTRYTTKHDDYIVIVYHHLLHQWRAERWCMRWETTLVLDNVRRMLAPGDQATDVPVNPPVSVRQHRLIVGDTNYPVAPKQDGSYVAPKPKPTPTPTNSSSPSPSNRKTGGNCEP